MTFIVSEVGAGGQLIADGRRHRTYGQAVADVERRLAATPALHFKLIDAWGFEVAWLKGEDVPRVDPATGRMARLRDLLDPDVTPAPPRVHPPKPAAA